MATASVASTSVTAYASVSSITITKPTGLAVGDLMIALVHKDDGNVDTCSSTGWTTLDSYDDNASSGDWAYSLSKVADSSDVAASNFTFTLGETKVTGGCILRVIDWDSSTTILHNMVADTTSGTGLSFSASLTPTKDSVLIFANFNSANVTTSSQAVATDNPSWTEVVDQGAATPTSMAVAWSYRNFLSATGNATATASGSTVAIGTLIAIASLPIVISDTISISEPAQSYGIGVTINDTTTITDTTTVTQNKWDNLNKNSSSWNNIDKS